MDVNMERARRAARVTHGGAWTRPAVAVVAVVAGLVAFASLGPSAWAEPPRVYVGVYLHDVTSFNQKDGVFDVDAEVWAKWRGDFDPSQLRVANAANVELVPLDVASDGAWNAARFRLRGTLRGEFPVHRFPFDEQSISVAFELPSHLGTLVPDLAGSGIADRFSLTDWTYDPDFRPLLSQERFPSDLGSLAYEGASAVVDKVAFVVVLRRPIVPVVLKLFVPLGIVALIVFASVFVHPELLQPRVTMCVTGLVACFAFQFSVSDVLPDVAYLTLTDALFIVVYVLSTCCVVTAVAVNTLHRGGRHRAALGVAWIARVSLPIVALIVVKNALPEPYPTPERGIDPIPRMERPPSSRDVLHVGTDRRLRTASMPSSVGAYWSLIHDDPQAGPQVVVVERAPGVENDAMRFLASGALEITWRIREGAKWSDGTPVTVDDLLLPMEASPDSFIARIETPDELTFVVLWSERLGRALEVPVAWPAHVLGPIFAEGGYDAVRVALGDALLPSLGPYRFTSGTEDRLVAEANPHFLGARPSIRRVEVHRFVDADALLAAFESGAIDMLMPNTLRRGVFEEVQARSPDVAHEVSSASLVLLHPDLGCRWLSRQDVRQAVMLALNRDRIAREIYGPAAVLAHGPSGPGVPYGATVYDYQPYQAREALERAGALGAEIALTYAANTDARLVEMIIEDLEVAGLKIRPVEVANVWGLWREGGHEGLMLHTVRTDDNGDARRWWNMIADDGRYLDHMRTTVYTDDVHEIVQREQRALYPERRFQLREQIDAVWTERLPSIPLVYASEWLLVDPTLRGWERPAQYRFGTRIESWHFRE